MAYPDGIDAMPTFTDGSGPTDLTPSAVLTAAEMTTITSAVTRTQSELGLAPSGPDATVRARLDRIESEVAGKADGSVAVTDAELEAALAGKAASVHAHAAADITDLAAATSAAITAALAAPLTLDGGTA